MKAIGFILAWSLYWGGDLVSRFACWKHCPWEWPYRLYSWFMCGSSDVQDYFHLAGPWREPTEEERFLE